MDDAVLSVGLNLVETDRRVFFLVLGLCSEVTESCEESEC